jgi:hypothetical protein
MVDVISYRKEFGLIIVGAIIFVTSFLWRDVVIEVEEMYFPKTDGIVNRIFFTLVVSIILVFIAVYLKDVWNLTEKTTTVEADVGSKITSDHADG